MTEKSIDVPAKKVMSEFLERGLPGTSRPIVALRSSLLDFTCSLTSRNVLLRGPVGAGKSTVARLVGILKRVAALRAEDARRILDDIKFDGHNRIDLRSMPWYVELTLTGLVETIAESQLFGSTKGAF